MLTGDGGPTRTTRDPFWSPPQPQATRAFTVQHRSVECSYVSHSYISVTSISYSQELGKAYLYLAPLAHRAETAQWLPVVDFSGDEVT